MARRDAMTAAVGLAAIVLCTFLGVTTEILPVGLLPQMSADLAVPQPVVGLLLTLYAVLVAALAVPVTRLTARIPRKPLLLGVVALYGIGDTVMALGPDFAVVCVGRGVAGCAHAVYFSVATEYAIALVPVRMRGRAVAVMNSGGSFGYVLGVPLATSIGAALGWRAAFGSLAFGALLLVATTAGMLPRLAARRGAGTAAAAPRGPLRVVAAANAVGFSAHYLLYTFVSPLLLLAGVPLTAIGAALFLFGGIGLLGLTAGGLAIDRRPRAGLATALGIAALGVGLVLVLSGPVPTVAAVAVWTLAFGAIPSYFASATVRTAALPTDLLAAVNNSMSNIGIAAGAAIGGAIDAVAGVRALVPVSCALFLATLVAVTVARRSFPTRP